MGSSSGLRKITIFRTVLDSEGEIAEGREWTTKEDEGGVAGRTIKDLYGPSHDGVSVT